MTDWLLGGILLALVVAIIERAVDGHATGYHLREISGSLRGIRAELERLQIDARNQDRGVGL